MEVWLWPWLLEAVLFYSQWLGRIIVDRYAHKVASSAVLEVENHTFNESSGLADGQAAAGRAQVRLGAPQKTKMRNAEVMACAIFPPSSIALRAEKQLHVHFTPLLHQL
jgi:hypothetical protein